MSFFGYKHLIYNKTIDSNDKKIHVIGNLQNLNQKLYKDSAKNSQPQNLVIQRCPCCYSRIKTFSEIKKYRCGYCKTNIIQEALALDKNANESLIISNNSSFTVFNKLFEKIVMSFNLHPYILINSENLEMFINDYERSDNKTEVMNNFVTLSFNVYSMTKSFANKNRIDYESLNSYYRLIFSSSKAVLKKLKYKIILKFYDIVTTVNVEDSKVSSNFLMSVLIILECPFIKNNIFSKNLKYEMHEKIKLIVYKILARSMCFIANCTDEKRAYLKSALISKGNENALQSYLEFNTVLINHLFAKIIDGQQQAKPIGFDFIFEGSYKRDDKDSFVANDKTINYRIKLNGYMKNLFLLSFFKFSQFLYDINKQREFIADRSFFYNVYVDFIDLKRDFDEMEHCRGNTSDNDYLFVSNFPHTIPIGCKLKFLESRFKTTMSFKAEESFIKSINQKKVEDLYFHLNINRSAILKDTIRQINDQLEVYRTLKLLREERQGNSMNDVFINATEMTMHKSLRVSFLGEPGLDASGLKREWFQKVIMEIFDTEKNDYFKSLENRKCWLKEDKSNRYLVLDRNSDVYFIIGIILGLSFYNCISSYIPLPITFYKKLLDVPLTIRDFREVYPQEYLYLTKVNTMNDDELLSMDLRFEVTIISDDMIANKENGRMQMVRDVELIPNGSNVVVNSKNKVEFIKSYMNYYLNSSVHAGFKRIQKGFKFILTDDYFYKMMSYSEIYQYYNDGLMNNSTEREGAYDVRYDLVKEQDIRLLSHVTKYINEGKSNYDKWTERDSMTIKWFWELMVEKTEEDRVSMKRYENCYFYKLMLFITGNGTIPACGLHVLELKITKLKNPKSKSATLYPIAHTCFNELCLYEHYESKEGLYESIMMSVLHENIGYGLR